MRSVFFPALAVNSAAVAPAGPPPTTATSWTIDILLFRRLRRERHDWTRFDFLQVAPEIYIGSNSVREREVGYRTDRRSPKPKATGSNPVARAPTRPCEVVRAASSDPT